MAGQCQERTYAESQCSRLAVEGSTFCWQHDVSDQVKARAHHRRHGDMDGDTCLLSECKVHYPVAIHLRNIVDDDVEFGVIRPTSRPGGGEARGR